MPNDDDRELSFWEKAVWLTFNHWEGEIWEAIHKAKTLFANLIDMVNITQAPNDSYMKNTLRWMAIRSCMMAQMAVVKFITWKD